MRSIVNSFCLMILALAVAVPAWAGDGPESVNLRDKFYDVNEWNGELWVFGYPGHIFVTKDKGKSWRTVASPVRRAHFDFASFDEKVGLIVGPDGGILRSEDGGASWKEVKSGVKQPLFAVFAVAGSSKAWAVGHFNTIIHSADKGKTWQSQKFVLPEDEEDDPGFNSLYFIDENTGWCVGEFGSVIHTVDGGITWTALPSPAPDPFYEVMFFDALKGVMVGAKGRILVTEDGGQSWRQRPIKGERHLFALSVAGDRIFAAGQDGYFVSLSIWGEDEGLPKRSGIYTWLGGVHFSDEKQGFAVGGRGSILKTVDGGQNWSKLAGR